MMAGESPTEGEEGRHTNSQEDSDFEIAGEGTSSAEAIIDIQEVTVSRLYLK